MIGIVLLAIFSIILLVYMIWEQYRHWTCARGIPGPPTIPLLGNALRFAGVDLNSLMETLTSFQVEYGTPFRMWLGPLLVIVIADPDHLETVLKSSENLKKSEVYRFFKDFGNGVFSAEGERWRKLRKILNTMFATGMMEDHATIFNAKGKKLMTILDRYADKGTFNLHDLINSAIVEIICRTAMGVDVEVQDRHDVEFLGYIRECTEITILRIIQVWLHPGWIFYNTPTGKKKKQLIKLIIDFIRDLMEKRKAILNAKQDGKEGTVNTSRTFLDHMFEHGIEENLSDYDLALTLNDIVVAGSDTSSVTTCYTVTMLGLHQDVQEKVYAEIKEVFGDSDREATLEDLNMLTQLDMAIKETLRLIGPPQIGRTLDKEIKLGDATVPVGTTIYMALYRLHRDPRFWQYPDKYYPDHFLPENVAKRPKHAYIPFSYGMRICPGQKYSFYAIKTVISTILRRYRVTCDLKPSEMTYTIAFMIELTNGYPIQLERRNKI